MGNMPLTRRMLIARDGGNCHSCGQPTHLRDPLHRLYATVDHLIPKSKGGTGLMDNLVLACLGCNRDKGALDAGEYLASLGDR